MRMTLTFDLELKYGHISPRLSMWVCHNPVPMTSSLQDIAISVHLHRTLTFIIQYDVDAHDDKSKHWHVPKLGYKTFS